MQHPKVGIAVCTLLFHVQVYQRLSRSTSPMALQAATPQTTITKDSQILEKIAVMNPDLPSPVLQNSYVVLGCWLVQGPEKRGVLQDQTIQLPGWYVSPKPWDCSMRLLSAVFLPPRISFKKKQMQPCKCWISV